MTLARSSSGTLPSASCASSSPLTPLSSAGSPSRPTTRASSPRTATPRFACGRCPNRPTMADEDELCKRARHHQVISPRPSLSRSCRHLAPLSRPLRSTRRMAALWRPEPTTGSSCCGTGSRSTRSRALLDTSPGSSRFALMPHARSWLQPRRMARYRSGSSLRWSVVRSSSLALPPRRSAFFPPRPKARRRRRIPTRRVSRWTEPPAHKTHVSARIPCLPRLSSPRGLRGRNLDCWRMVRATGVWRKMPLAQLGTRAQVQMS
mmetsp:Transcript_13635/g.43570  ORF Transcript_13635/g.43570 Transcript_13635/m.43570 type:complete len:263 (-) Transcript_13635:89-877(-)